MKIVTVLGARPQFIKASTISRALKNSMTDEEVIVHTGQHYDQNMSNIFFEQLDIPKPNYYLQVTSKLHGQMTGKMLEAIEKVMLKEKPDAVLVYGDTNSTLAGALAAAKLHIPIAHVEAGLRSFNRKMPEEINRVLTDHLSSWLFAPTSASIKNLKNEGINQSNIFEVGDVMYDAILHYGDVSDKYSHILEDLNLVQNYFVLATIHRAENTNDKGKLEQIVKDLILLAKDHVVVFPVHPRTKNLLGEFHFHENIKAIDPVGYLDMISLQKNSRIIVTDSGGVQKEAFFNRKFCVTVREETEWIELVQEGYNFLCGSSENISSLVNRLWDEPFKERTFHPYGDGRAAEKIISILTGCKTH